MNPSTLAELRAALDGVELPAHKARLLEYAVQQHAEPSLLDALQSLPEIEYATLDDVLERLAA